MTQTVVVVDAFCDLPKSYMDEHQIRIIPLPISLAGTDHYDYRDMRQTSHVYQQSPNSRLMLSPAYKSDEIIVNLLKQDLLPQFSQILVITSDSKRSPANHLIREVSFQHKEDFIKWRGNNGLAGEKPKLKIIDSTSIASGQGLLTYEAVRLLTEKAMPYDRIPAALEKTTAHLETLVAIDDISVLKDKQNLTLKGNLDTGAFSWMDLRFGKLRERSAILKIVQGRYEIIAKPQGNNQALAQVLEQAGHAIKTGLLPPVVNISYSGTMSALRTNALVTKFTNLAQQQRVRVFTSMMSLSGAASLGRNAIAISFIRK